MRATILREGLQDLIDLLRRRGYCVVGPTLRDNAIVYDEVTALDDLPAGCAFRTRCTYADKACLAEPDITAPADGRQVRCFHPLVAAPEPEVAR